MIRVILIFSQATILLFFISDGPTAKMSEVILTYRKTNLAIIITRMDLIHSPKVLRGHVEIPKL